MLALSRRNFAATHALVTARTRRLRPLVRHVSRLWVLVGLAWLAAVVAAALLLDAPAASVQGTLPEWLLVAANVSTRLALGNVYIIPAVLVLVWANLTDWSAWRGRGLLLIYNRTAAAAFVLASVAIPGVLANMLKYGFGRARPLVSPELGVFQFHPFTTNVIYASFPSGHATTTGAVATILILLFPRWRYAVAALALWIASTRVVLGAHHPSDIVAGLGLGATTTLLLALLFARLGYLFETGPDGILKLKKTGLILFQRSRFGRGSASSPASRRSR